MRARTFPVVVAISLVAAACTSSPLQGPETTETLTTSDTTSPTTSGTVTVTAGGGSVEVDAGSVVVPAGALPAGTDVTVTVAEDAAVEFPAAATPVGQGLSITSSAEPTEPVLVEFPVPPGEETGDLYLLHVFDDGSYEYVGGMVVGDTFISALREFSGAWVVHLKVSELLDLPDVDLPTLYGGDPMPPFPAEAEAVALAQGRVDEPFVRSIRIVGPVELMLGGDGLLVADGFEARRSDFVTYEWGVYGGGGIEVTSTDGKSLRFAAIETGRYTVTVVATDPTTGATAFAAHPVFVVEEGMVVYALPNADSYGSGDFAPVVTVGVIGGTPPVFIEWNYGPYGDGGLETAATVPWELAVVFPRRALPGEIHVTATDSAGVEATVSALLPTRSVGARGIITGPLRARVGEPANYVLTLSPEVNRDGLQWEVFPAPAQEGSRILRTMTWGEPGVARIRVLYEHPVIGLTAIDLLVVVISGEAEPLEALLGAIPADLSAGAESTWVIQGRGGVVAPFDGFWGYTAEIDFGNGNVVSGIEIPSTTATEPSPPVEVGNIYEKAGTYEVTLRVTDTDGSTAEATAKVTVLDRIVAGGEFTIGTLVPTEVEANRIRIVIDKGVVSITRFELYTISAYVGFNLGEDETFEASCHNHSQWELIDFSAAFDAETGAITGTATMLWDRLDVGTDCPFGGIDQTQTRTMALNALLVDGAIEGLFKATDHVLPAGVGLWFTAKVRE